jgi:hypothetical protein
MKRFRQYFLFILLLLAGSARLTAQDYQHLLRGFDDNDGIDVRGMGTDEGYTNGTRIDLFYRTRKPHAFLHSIMPKAGDSSINTAGWGLMQVMYTPKELKLPFPDPDDYHYAGGLYITHTLHSANARKKLNLQSEILLGVMGPASLASGFQKIIHSVGGFVTPRGWEYQLPTDLLLNYNFTAEKQLLHIDNGLDLTGGGTLMAGTLQTSAQAFTLLRFGKLFSYYDGLIQQYTRRNSPGRKQWQLYGMLQPGIQWVGYNAMYQGGVFNRSSPLRTKSHDDLHTKLQPEPWVAQFDFGVVASSGNFAVICKQSLRTREVKKFQPHSIGTISLQLAW